MAISLERWVAVAVLPVVLSRAGGPSCTRLATAQRLAFTTDLVAHLIVLALLISQTAHIRAAHQGVALLASGTEADGNVVLHLALGPSAT